MAKLEVVNYSIKWHPVDNKGEVRTVFSDGQAVRLPVDSTEEFIAITVGAALMLVGVQVHRSEHSVISPAISAAWVASAKWPVSSRCHHTAWSPVASSSGGTYT